MTKFTVLILRKKKGVGGQKTATTSNNNNENILSLVTLASVRQNFGTVSTPQKRVM